MIKEHIASLLDYTILKPEITVDSYDNGVKDCLVYNFASYCVGSAFVPFLLGLLVNKKCHTKICSTVGFPLGSSCPDSKLLEIYQGVRCGAVEFDVVPFICAIKSHDWKYFENEVMHLRSATDGFVLKIILEVGLLTDDEIKKASSICVNHSVDYVKTSTGFLSKLSSEQTGRYVSLLSDVVKGSPTLVKASGGIKTLADVNLMIACGASRIGTSNAVSIMAEI